jgi:hypothetical protein
VNPHHGRKEATMNVQRSLLAALALAGPALALAGEETFIFKTFEDESTPPVMSICENAGFPKPVNVFLGASVWSLKTSGMDGEVVRETVRKVGTVTGCGVLTSFSTFEPEQYMLMHFELADGAYVFSGQCDVVSFGVPAPGLMLVGCALGLVDAPPGVVGGLATSASIFTPWEIPGYSTGSVWTLHLYTEDDEDASPRAGGRPARWRSWPHEAPGHRF